MYLVDEFARMSHIMNSENITFVRYGDGEVMLALGHEINESTQAFLVDKWSCPAGVSKIGKSLQLMLRHPEWYYGIPCQCCNTELKHKLLEMLPKGINPSHVTFANLFVNAAYPLFLSWIAETSKEVVLLANFRGKSREYPFTVIEFFELQDDCVGWWETSSEQIILQAQHLAKKYHNKLFFVFGWSLESADSLYV